jgi:hypothetical protein
MSIVRRDDTVQNTLGNAIAGAACYYLTQPTNLPALTPLANVYSDTTGTPTTNPQITDGAGHAVAYLTAGVLYTVVYVYPNGTQVVYEDQFVGTSSGAPTPWAGVPTGPINGTNKVFTVVNGSTPLAAIPTQLFATFNGIFLTLGLGYTLAVVSGQLQITYANAPQPASGPTPADSIFAQGLL